MTYNPNIPQATDFLSVSQGDLLNNFGAANTIFGTDHITFNAASNNGQHKKVTWQDQTGSIPTASSNELVAYNVTTAGISSLKYQKDNTATVFTLNPIKAYGLISTVGGGGTVAQTIVDSFNVTSVSRTGGTATVTLTEPMKSVSYSVLVYETSGTITLRLATIVSATSFTFTVTAAGGTNVTFLCLES